MTALAEIISDMIREDGPMALDRYMALCLGHPQHGYYTTRDPLGAAGDFTTSPEISQIFGELIGVWVAQVWQFLGAPRHFALIELGPGRGTLMADMLRVLCQDRKMRICRRGAFRRNKPHAPRRPAIACSESDVASYTRLTSGAAQHRHRQRVLRCAAHPPVRAA